MVNKVRFQLVCIYCLLITMFDCTTFRPKINSFYRK